MAVTVIDNFGNTTEFQNDGNQFRLYLDGDALQPALVESIEVESNSQTDSTGTMCGDQIQRATSKDPFTVRIEGVVTNDDSSGELTTDNLLFDIQEGDFVTFTSALGINDPMEVTNVLVRQESSLVQIDSPVTNGMQQAFRFNLQLGAQENQN